jgi:hypothetical protein
MSIGFMLDLIDIGANIEKGIDIHADEKHYHLNKDIYPFVVEKHKSGKMSDKAFNRWMEDFKELEDIYG